MRKHICHARKSGHPFYLFWIAAFAAMTLWIIDYGLLTMDSLADTIYLKNGTIEKGLVVEEYYDRFVVSTPDGEKEILQSKINDIFFDDSYQNNLYMGKRFEDGGDFEKALQFYKLSLISNPNFKEAKDAIKGLEDSKWRFKKSWNYGELKTILEAQLGLVLKTAKEKIVISKVSDTTIISGNTAVSDTLYAGDAIIKCWAKPLTYAGLKNASRILIGLSNTILQLTIERDIKVQGISGFRLFSPMVISMEFEGPRITSLKKESRLYNSGLREGDLIVSIDGENTRYMKLAYITKRIFNGSKDKIVTITREVTLMRRRSESGTSTAMWVWNSKEILLDEARREELLKFCQSKNIGVLFFQLQYQFIPYKGETACRLLYETKLRAFLKDTHAQGMIIYALDGSPEFCLEDKHHLVLAQIRAILDFNKKGLTLERFDGVHYDNEPYLLPVFNSHLKEETINQFLNLNRKCRDLISSSGVKLDFGIDIPFWFDQLDRLDAKLIDICDNVGIMDYRNFASSDDGMIAHALDELKYASQARKKVFVGIETSKYPKQKVYFVSILTEDEFNKRVADAELPLHAARFEDFSLSVYHYGGKAYIGLVKPEGVSNGDFKNALSKLEVLFGRIPKVVNEEELDEFTFDIMKILSTNPEFRDIQVQEYVPEPTLDKNGVIKAFLIFIADEVMLEKLTFADLTEKDLKNTLAEAEREFKNYPSFEGFAVHYYKSYKELCEKKQE